MILTPRQSEVQSQVLAGPATHGMVYGGSRSGKTALIIRAILIRALKAPRSRHAMFRFRFNAIKASIVLDTYPKIHRLCFPHIPYDLNKTDYFVTLPNGSEIWFGGLDDKERTEKVLGQEYATIYLNEVPQITWDSRNIAVTRLAQKAICEDGSILRLRAYYDCNPTNKAHWSYKVFHDHVDPETRLPLANPDDFAWAQMNPTDNLANLPPGYLIQLDSLSARLQKRFKAGEFAEANPSALFNDIDFDTWRVDKAPELQRIIIGVDPSGADEGSTKNDAVGIVVAGLGIDGNGYILEDCTISGAGPGTWGRMVASAYDRHDADSVVGEVNYGGAMVKFTVLSARSNTPFKMVTASRGKHVRAEPISALYEKGKVRHVGAFPELEEEYCAFSTHGYTGPSSPNRADSAIWALTELFPGIVSERKATSKKIQTGPTHTEYPEYANSWMS